MCMIFLSDLYAGYLCLSRLWACAAGPMRMVALVCAVRHEQHYRDAQQAQGRVREEARCALAAAAGGGGGSATRYLFAGIKLGFMSAFVKAAASSLVEIPSVNAGERRRGERGGGACSRCGAVIDGGDIVYRDYVDVSVAVASPRG